MEALHGPLVAELGMRSVLDHPASTMMALTMLMMTICSDGGALVYAELGPQIAPSDRAHVPGGRAAAQTKQADCSLLRYPERVRWLECPVLRIA